MLLIRRAALLVVGLCTGLLAAGGLGSAAADAQQAPGPAAPLAAVAVFDEDPAHLWNRVHAALYVRRDAEGLSLGVDRLDPLLWRQSRHLREGPSAERAVAVLEEFLREDGHALFEEPLKRAVLQRDLWQVFNWLVAGESAAGPSGSVVPPTAAAQSPLATLLAAAIGKLALTAEQIADLPDNYSAAVASRRFLPFYNEREPEKSYLPPSLLDVDGPWVCVGRSEGVTAPVHFADGGDQSFNSSVFLLFIKQPGGRDTAQAWLRRARGFDQPLVLPNTEGNAALSPFMPNPVTPAWAHLTELALVRQALLVDSTGRIVASPLTESVQLRVLPEVPRVIADEDLSFITGSPEFEERAVARQKFYEYRLAREALFAGRAGGLRDVSGDRELKTDVGSHPWDPLETDFAAATELLQSGPVVRRTCLGCHHLPGVYGFQSYFDFPRALAGGEVQPQQLVALPLDSVRQRAVEAWQSLPAWAALSALLDEQAED